MLYKGLVNTGVPFPIAAEDALEAYLFSEPKATAALLQCLASADLCILGYGAICQRGGIRRLLGIGALKEIRRIRGLGKEIGTLEVKSSIYM